MEEGGGVGREERMSRNGSSGIVQPLRLFIVDAISR